jgi:hypothetical protein
LFIAHGALSAADPAETSAPKLHMQGDESARYVTLSWGLVENEQSQPTEYQLQEARAAKFSDGHIRYQGPHRSTVISGLPNGVRHYRVRQRPQGSLQWSGWSVPRTFHVTHHSRSLAAGLFSLGAFVFIATLSFLLLMSRRQADD